MASWNPEPRPGRKPPSSVVVSRPAPGVVRDPGPAIRPQAHPTAAVIGAPSHVHARIPDVPVGGVMSPRSISVERRRVGTHIIRQILRGHAKALIAPLFGPSIEGVPRRRVVDVRGRRRGAFAGERPLPGTDVTASLFVDELGRTAQHGELDVRIPQNRDAIFARDIDLYPRRGRI